MIWRISTARSLARQSGLDPGMATQMTLLSENGLDATYLAELMGLLDQGLITQAEYAERRAAIIGSV